MTQALRGERVTIYDRNGEGLAWGQIESDGYVGWLPDAARLVEPGAAPTHRVTAMRTFAFPGPSIKLPPVETLVMGSQLAVVREDGTFAITREGWHLPKPHVAAIEPSRADFVAVAERIPRHALSLGRQEQLRHRLLGPGAGFAHGCRHRLPARQRHAAGRTRQECGRIERNK